jgi:glycosyltransferase involved in cell wall biosynthesis
VGPRVKVLFLTTAYPTPERPVFGTFVREHARAAATVADVSVVHLDRGRAERGAFDVMRVHGEPVPTWRVRYRRLPRPLSYGAFLAGTLAAVRRTGRPDVIHAHSFVAALAGLVLGAAFRRRVVYTEHWSVFLPDDPATLSAPMRRLARFTLERARVVLPVSEALRDALERLAPRARFRVVRNAVDDVLFTPAESTPEPRLITVGLMDDESKGFDDLLEAVALVPDVPLDIVGDGALRARYEERSAQLGLEGRVTFHGLKSKQEIAELLRRASVFVLASRFENNPVVVLEAQCSGLPVVATAVGGLPEVVPDAVPPGDARAFAAGIRAALERSADREGIAADARERYGLAAVGAELRGVYSEVVR